MPDEFRYRDHELRDLLKALTHLAKTLDKLLKDFGHPKGRLVFFASPPRNKQSTESIPMFSVQIDTAQEVIVTLAPETDQGVKLDTSPAPVWSVEDTGNVDPATLIPSADGLSATLVSSSTPGDTSYLVSAFAGGKAISGEVVLTVVAAAVTGALVFSAAAPTPK